MCQIVYYHSQISQMKSLQLFIISPLCLLWCFFFHRWNFDEKFPFLRNLALQEIPLPPRTNNLTVIKTEIIFHMVRDCHGSFCLKHPMQNTKEVIFMIHILEFHTWILSLCGIFCVNSVSLATWFTCSICEVNPGRSLNQMYSKMPSETFKSKKVMTHEQHLKKG